MKRTLTLLAVSAIIFSSCSKKGTGIEPESENPLYQVKFAATGFEQSIIPIGNKYSLKAETGLKSNLNEEGVTNIEFLVYDSKGSLIGTKSEPYAATGVTTADKFELKLPKGQYTVGVVAGPESLSKDAHEKEKHLIFLSKVTSGGRSIIDNKAVFVHQYSTFEVKDQPVTSTLKLTRRNAKLELNIQDAIPSKVAYILFGGKLSTLIRPFNNSYNSISSQSNGFVKLDLQPAKGKPVTTISTNFYPEYYAQASSYNILFFGSDNAFLGSTTVDNVSFKENHITRLTGNLFENYNSDDKQLAMKVDFVKEYSTEVIEGKL